MGCTRLRIVDPLFCLDSDRNTVEEKHETQKSPRWSRKETRGIEKSKERAQEQEEEAQGKREGHLQLSTEIVVIMTLYHHCPGSMHCALFMITMESHHQCKDP